MREPSTSVRPMRREPWAVLSTGSSDAKERADAVLALHEHHASSGWHPPEVISSSSAPQEVVAALHEDNTTEVRRASIRLAELFCRTEPDSILPHTHHIAKSLADEDATVRRWSAVTLAGLAGQATDSNEVFAKHLPSVRRAVRDQDGAVRFLAVGALARMGNDAAGIAQMHAASVADALVHDEDVDVRRAAAFALSQMDDSATAHAAKLVEALKDKDVDVRRLAANTLERMAELVSSFSKELVQALRDEDVIVRRWVARSLEHVARTRHTSQYAKEIADSLVRDPDPWVRMWVLLTLARIGREAKSTLTQVTHACCDTSCLPVQCIAIGTMAQFGDQAKWFACRHAGIIKLALSSDDDEVRRVGALATALLGEAETLPVGMTLAALKDGDAFVRRGAARALEQRRDFSEDEIKEAADALRDPDVAVQLSGLRLMAHLDSAAEPYADEVNEVLRNCDGALKTTAITALPHMGEKGLRLMHQYRMEQEAEQVHDDALSMCQRKVKEKVWEFWRELRTLCEKYLPSRSTKKGDKSDKSDKRVYSDVSTSGSTRRLSSFGSSPKG